MRSLLELIVTHVVQRMCVKREFHTTHVLFLSTSEIEAGTRRRACEAAASALLLLTSAILNHNCPVLLVQRIHKREAPLLPPFLCLSFSLSLSFPSCLSLLLSFFFLLKFLLSFSLPLTCPDASPLLVGNKRSSATAATVAIVALVGAKLPQFCTFYTAREKKRIIFGGNATILSAVVMWDQLVSTAAARYTCLPCALRSATGLTCFRMSFWSGDDTATSSVPRRVSTAAILTTLKNNLCGIHRTSTRQSTTHCVHRNVM